MPLETLRLAIVGDVHLCWDDADVRLLDGAGYDRVVFVGDLGEYRHAATLRVCRSIARLRTPALVVPGNHDGPSIGALAAEVMGRPGLVRPLNRGQAARVEAMRAALGEVAVAGYSRHALGEDVDLIAGRPHSMGGATVAFAPFLKKAFGVRTMEESAQRLRELIDGSASSSLVFVAHNGPSGLGDRRGDLWGCDFRAEEGDQGDPDLRDAVAHAERVGKRVVAVIAGHMHHRLRGGGLRTWSEHRDGVLYVNAARVPRVFEQGGRTVRHHVEVVLGEGTATAREVLL